MTIDHSNVLYLLEYGTGIASLIRIGVDGYVSRISLGGMVGGQSRNGICVDSVNNVYIADTEANKIYRYRTNGVLEVFAGSGNAGGIDGNGIFTSFSSPKAIMSDTADNIYVFDGGYRIRRINQNRDVVTIAGHYTNGTDMDGAGTNSAFYLVSGMCSDGAGNIYMACFSGVCGESIRKMNASTNVTTIAGSFTQNGYADGVGSASRFKGGGNEGICFSQGKIFLADYGNCRIRNITNNPTAQVVLPANLSLGSYAGLQITGTVGRTYQIQSSPNTSSWTNTATILLNSSPYLWIDQNPIQGNKYYRALLLP
ncbi:MAG: hypothetical protein JWQ71_830 [Pedosphaera sp.]|nr:hypothetical protein [Pedosphaera sp.]